jgi:pimeloyl-ACP methyl ester carboxylesterase/DNA-binding transcriptional MerR regulator
VAAVPPQTPFGEITMRFEALKVGELAQRTGLTVRTLHHYDGIGLLRPSLHTEAGYRLYTAGDIARLQQVLSLRQLGFSLDEVRGCLDRPGFSALEVIGLHLVRLRGQIESQRRLCDRLEILAAHLRAAGDVSADEFLDTIEEMTMLETLEEKYFTPEQLQAIKEGREQAGPENLNRMQEYWAELIALIRTEMEQGTDPADPKVQELARRWQELLTRSTGGDPGIKQAMKRLWEEQGDALAAQFGSKYDSRPIWGYIETAIRHGEGATATNNLDQTVRDHEGGEGGVDRRDFLKRMAWAGTGLVGTARSGVLGSHAFAQGADRAGATAGRFSFASFDGTKIAYSDEGDGPAVVLLHGFGVDGLDNFGHFDRLLPKLERTRALLREQFGAAPPLLEPPAEGRPGLAARLREAGARVIVPDMRGFGASDKPQDTRTYADSAMARDVIALVRHLGVDAVDVLGFSMGSVTAAKMLALGAPQVRSAVLAGVSQYILEGEMADLPKHYPVPDGLTRPFTMRAHAEALANLVESAGNDTDKPKSPSAILVRSTGGDPKVLAAVLRGAMAEQVPVEALRQAKVPVLVLNGKADLANQAVARLLEVIPNAHSESCDGDHHTTPWYPSFQQAVINFFAAQWRARGASIERRATQSAEQGKCS